MASLADATAGNVTLLVGGLAPPLRVRYWAHADDFADSDGSDAGLGDAFCGPGYPDRWVVFVCEPDVRVDISVYGSGDVSDLQATAAYRTGPSVLVAIAAVAAAHVLGQGRFDPSIDQILKERIEDPHVLMDRLRLTSTTAPDFESASREILLGAPGFRDWNALHPDT